MTYTVSTVSRDATDHKIVHIITDAYGRTIDPREFATLAEARLAAQSIECPCGVWVVPHATDDTDAEWELGVGEEVSPEQTYTV